MESVVAKVEYGTRHMYVEYCSITYLQMQKQLNYYVDKKIINNIVSKEVSLVLKQQTFMHKSFTRPMKYFQF